MSRNAKNIESHQILIPNRKSIQGISYIITLHRDECGMFQGNLLQWWTFLMWCYFCYATYNKLPDLLPGDTLYHVIQYFKVKWLLKRAVTTWVLIRGLVRQTRVRFNIEKCIFSTNLLNLVDWGWKLSNRSKILQAALQQRCYTTWQIWNRGDNSKY